MVGSQLISIAASINHKNLVVVGEKKSGKTSLISSFIGEPAKDDVKSTAALEFKFGRKEVNNKKEICNIYELGGGRLLENLVSAPLSKESISKAIAVIAIDLSRPGIALDSLSFWMNVLRE